VALTALAINDPRPARRRGLARIAVVLAFLGLRGRLVCHDWWGSRGWPAIVDTFVGLSSDPEADSWQRDHLSTRPIGHPTCRSYRPDASR
jgi:hypothetical protein